LYTVVLPFAKTAAITIFAVPLLMLHLITYQLQLIHQLLLHHKSDLLYVVNLAPGLIKPSK
jgi:hypothetical protein